MYCNITKMISTKLIAITMVVASLTVIGAVAVMTTTNLNQPVYAQGTQPSGSATNNIRPITVPQETRHLVTP